MINTVFKKGKKVIKGFDLFSNNQYFRYNKNSDYTSFSGGVLSLLLIIIFLVVLIQGFISAIAK